MKVEKVAGPWLSLGFHVDFQKRYVDLHIAWWIITIGKDYYHKDNCQHLYCGPVEFEFAPGFYNACVICFLCGQTRAAVGEPIGRVAMKDLEWWCNHMREEFYNHVNR